MGETSKCQQVPCRRVTVASSSHLTAAHLSLESQHRRSNLEGHSGYPDLPAVTLTMATFSIVSAVRERSQSANSKQDATILTAVNTIPVCTPYTTMPSINLPSLCQPQTMAITHCNAAFLYAHKSPSLPEGQVRVGGPPSVREDDKVGLGKACGILPFHRAVRVAF